MKIGAMNAVSNLVTHRSSSSGSTQQAEPKGAPNEKEEDEPLLPATASVPSDAPVHQGTVSPPGSRTTLGATKKSKFSLTAKSFADEDELSRADMQMIKAKTMYDMVEELDTCKLLFLSNAQAMLLGSSKASLDKLLAAILEDKPHPKLVIKYAAPIPLTPCSHLRPRTAAPCWQSAGE